MILEPATDQDFDEAYTLLVACKEDLMTQNIGQWDDNYPNPDHVAADIHQGGLFKYVLETDIVGIISIDSKQEPEYSSIPWTYTGGSIAIIHRLAVHPLLQGRGYGSRIMDGAEKIINEKDFSTIRLDAYAGNLKLLEFYEKRGYRRVGDFFYPSRPLPFICFEKRP